MTLTNKKLPKAVELPVCPFCDGSVYYASWTTHKIFQMECSNCKAHWRTGVSKSAQREMYVELTSYMKDQSANEHLNKKLPLDFWRDMVLKRINI